MMLEKKYIAIIPARGGSKRLPRKNVLPLSNKPLVAWTIEAALQCKKIEKVVVTSDDDEILSVAKGYTIEALKRPAELASDIASSIDVVKHVIKYYPDYEYTILLQPTSPLRTGEHIKSAIDFLEGKKADSVISVCKADHNPHWMNTLPPDLSMVGFVNQNILNLRSQDLQDFYRLNGAIYICKTEMLLKQGRFLLNANSYAFVMDSGSSVDIDEELDFRWAEYLMTATHNSKLYESS